MNTKIVFLGLLTPGEKCAYRLVADDGRATTYLVMKKHPDRIDVMKNLLEP